MSNTPILSFFAAPDVLSEQAQTPNISIFTLTAPTPAAGLAIEFDLSGSTAIGGVDFDLDLGASENILNVEFLPDGSGGTVTLAGGITTASIMTIPLLDADADQEVLSVTLLQGEGFLLDPDNNSFETTITDLPIVSFTASPDVLPEQLSKPNISTFTLTAPTPAEGLAIDFDLSGSTAVGGIDFGLDLAASDNILGLEFLPDGSGGTVTLAGEGGSQQLVLPQSP